MNEEPYSVMTVNERLYISDNISAFDKAVVEKDIEGVKKILKTLELDDLSIQDILKHYKLI